MISFPLLLHKQIAGEARWEMMGVMPFAAAAAAAVLVALDMPCVPHTNTPSK
jgi:hypothetical protein